MTRKIILILIFCLWESTAAFSVLAQATATPTPPPPPLGITPTAPSDKGGNKKPTQTPTPRPSGNVFPQPPGTPPLTATPTAPPTPTATLPPTLIRLTVFMDGNRNGTFDTGEGVTGLLGLARRGDWLTYGLTENGVLFLPVSPDVPAGEFIAVEVPYLHWSTQVRAPENNGTAEAVLRLELPEYPVFLP
ncbi:MAG: hypothetical protein HUU38_28935 [Anaerolineales bacterium]|nr:hypothetical protein [Anaerolineales bacterium]